MSIAVIEAIVKWMKIHVQIMRFKYCLNMGFNLTTLKMSPELFTWFYKESVGAQTDHSSDASIRESVACGYDVIAKLWGSKVCSWLHFVKRNPV